jgi:hypothetical protein
MSEALLPAPFAQLQPFVSKWDQPGTNERYAKRLSSNIAELQEFYDGITPLIPNIKAYLDAKPFDGYTDADRRLGRLVFAWVYVAEAVEVFKQPRVPNSKNFWNMKIEPEL